MSWQMEAAILTRTRWEVESSTWWILRTDCKYRKEKKKWEGKRKRMNRKEEGAGIKKYVCASVREQSERHPGDHTKDGMLHQIRIIRACPSIENNRDSHEWRPLEGHHLLWEAGKKWRRQRGLILQTILCQANFLIGVPKQWKKAQCHQLGSYERIAYHLKVLRGYCSEQETSWRERTSSY